MQKRVVAKSVLYATAYYETRFQERVLVINTLKYNFLLVTFEKVKRAKLQQVSGWKSNVKQLILRRL